MCDSTLIEQRSTLDLSTRELAWSDDCANTNPFPASTSARQILTHLDKARNDHPVPTLKKGSSTATTTKWDIEEVTEYLELIQGHQDQVDDEDSISAFRKTTTCSIVSRAGGANVSLDQNGNQIPRTTEKVFGHDTWQIDLDHVGLRLKKRVFDEVISTLYGQAALRIVNLLLDKHKLDEKAVSEGPGVFARYRF